MRNVCSILAVIVGLLGVSTPLLKADPLPQVCAFLDAAIVSGDHAMAHISKMAWWWPDEQQDSLLPTIHGVLKGVRITGGSIYLAGELGEDTKDYLIVVHVAGSSVAYLRLLFERTDNGLQFRQFAVDGEYSSMLSDHPTLQTPVKQTCP